MRSQFEWQIDDPDGDDRRTAALTWQRGWRRWLIPAAVIGLLALAGYGFYRQQQRAGEEQVAAVQAVLDLEREALRSGDGELFLSVQDRSPAWLSAQLLPVNQAVTRAGLTATRVEAGEADVWANVRWTADGATWQRVAFFETVVGRLQHGPGGDDYWGEAVVSRHTWGTLRLHAVDASWRQRLAAFVAEIVAETCAGGCREEAWPFELIIADDFSPTARPGELRHPSPRLVALDGDGQPGDPFWEMLRRRLQVYLSPATIRFAVPAYSRSRYERLATEFSAAQPDLRVEIIPFDEGPDRQPIDAMGLLTAVDGAHLRPDESLLASGLVYDLTDFARTDPAFDQSDFYEQIWRGAWWQDRMWLMPQAAGLRLLFYDLDAYATAGLPQPGWHWTWHDLEADLDALRAAPGNQRLRFGLQDTGRDTLFAYAFNWQNGCAAPFTTGCNPPLDRERVAAALAWYATMVAEGQIPDVTGLPPAERLRLGFGLETPRRVAFWVEEPLNYEHHLLLEPLGVAPFPGAPGYDGVTPLWVYGGVISGMSERPLAVWGWLKFLSHRSVDRQLRLVPARPSVARATGYWRTLPTPLAEVLHVAFPFARPVTIAEAGVFGWDRVTAVVNGDLSPEQVAASSPRTRWFSTGK